MLHKQISLTLCFFPKYFQIFCYLAKYASLLSFIIITPNISIFLSSVLSQFQFSSSSQSSQLQTNQQNFTKETKHIEKVSILSISQMIFEEEKNHPHPSYSKRRKIQHRPSCQLRPSSQHCPCDEQLQHTLNGFTINDMSNS